MCVVVGGLAGVAGTGSSPGRAAIPRATEPWQCNGQGCGTPSPLTKWLTRLAEIVDTSGTSCHSESKTCIRSYHVRHTAAHLVLVDEVVDAAAGEHAAHDVGGGHTLRALHLKWWQGGRAVGPEGHTF